MQPPAESSSESSERVVAGADAPQIVLIGASVRAAAESARRAGFSVTGLDQFGDVDTRRACERYLSLADGRAPAEIAGELPAAAAVVIVGGLGGADRLLRLLRKRQAVFGSPRREPACQLEFAQLKRIAEQSGMRVPPTFLCAQRPRNSAGRRWLVKAANSAGGLGVQWAGTEESAGTTRAWYQQWTAGRPLGAVFLAIAGSAALLGVCRSSFTRHRGCPFTYAGSSGPASCDSQLQATLVRFGNAYAAERSVTGLFNVDFILDRENRIWVLEINRRWSASCEVIESALVRTGRLQGSQSLFGWHWRALTGARVLPDTWQEATRRGSSVSGAAGKDPVVWKRIVYCRRSGRFHPEKLPRAGATGNVRFADLPQPAARVQRGEPLLTLICQENFRSPISWRTKRGLIAAAQATVVP